MSPDTKEIIENAASQCENLECDGTVKVISYLLNENHIPHKIMRGYVKVIENKVVVDSIPLHFWIELPEGLVVDYKAQMWLGNSAPNGIFKFSDYPNYVYKGIEVKMEVPKIIYQILTNKF